MKVLKTKNRKSGMVVVPALTVLQKICYLAEDFCLVSTRGQKDKIFDRFLEKRIFV